MTLGRKQSIRDQGTWQAARARSREEWPNDRLDALVDKTVENVKAVTKGKRTAYGWSGGKDSLALQYVMEQAGIEDSVLSISALEFPAMLQWMTDHMPDGLTIRKQANVNLGWLRDRPHMLFPQGKDGPKWFQLVNHAGQNQHWTDHRLEMLVLGRRRPDQNFCGPKETNVYTNKQGVTRFSPLADWSHEAVFALIEREGMDLPPCYGWPRGYQIGTGSWPARQWTDSQDFGFQEVWEIDPDVVRGAAADLPQAADWMARKGLS